MGRSRPRGSSRGKDMRILILNNSPFDLLFCDSYPGLTQGSTIPQLIFEMKFNFWSRTLQVVGAHARFSARISMLSLWMNCSRLKAGVANCEKRPFQNHMLDDDLRSYRV